MRIAIINWSRRKVGGIGTYLGAIIPELSSAGHEVAFWYEVDVPLDREQIILPQGAPAWCASEMGIEASLTSLRAWQPDVIYTHKVEDPELEAEIIRIAPSVFFAHDYQGTCISGLKTFKNPVVRPCSRRFGRECLLHYYPHRCGGWSPITMVKLYRLQSKRLKLLHRYDAIVTHSQHMLSELIKHGLSPQHAYSFPYYVKQPNDDSELSHEFLRSDSSSLPVMDSFAKSSLPVEAHARTDWHLLFSGRMELLKGAHFFLDALTQVAGTLERPLRITFAGDGRERQSLERQAARLQAQNEELEIVFIGWVNHSQMDSLLQSCDLMVVPSLWPEPFGLVGPEAGLRGIPVAAYAVGGICDWLIDGVNGYLAPGNPPTPAGLAHAIVRCLRDPDEHARLGRGAVKIASQFNIRNHLTSLLKVFESVSIRK